jgi:hypothetical protein
VSEPQRPSLDEVLMTVVIELLFFLEHTPAEQLDPQAAQRMTSEIAYQMSRVPPEALEPQIRFVRLQEQTSAWPAERAFLDALPGHLGWT